MGYEQEDGVKEFERQTFVSKMRRSRGRSAALNYVADMALSAVFAVVLSAAAAGAQMDFDEDGRLLHEVRTASLMHT